MESLLVARVPNCSIALFHESKFEPQSGLVEAIDSKFTRNMEDGSREEKNSRFIIGYRPAWKERELWYEAATRAIEARIRASAASSSVSGTTPPGGVARGVVLFVGDGMGMSTLTAARILSGQRHGNTGEETQLAWDSFPAVALARTATKGRSSSNGSHESAKRAVHQAWQQASQVAVEGDCMDQPFLTSLTFAGQARQLAEYFLVSSIESGTRNLVELADLQDFMRGLCTAGLWRPFSHGSLRKSGMCFRDVSTTRVTIESEVTIDSGSNHRYLAGVTSQGLTDEVLDARVVTLLE
ncbi:Alkaline phosphatase, tissue-nonspecific isozyme [Eufriesea mexicana]|nr:Alkaline phosphatase, tissue-nonspecific isozyme [Eufriesea mexicana]